MLISYQQTTRRILNDVGFVKFNDFDLRDWINIARNQAALEGEAIRVVGNISTVGGTQSYAFSAISLSGSGLGAVQAVRQISSGSNLLLYPRTWEWMFQYYVAPQVASGTPIDWAQLGQGASGTFYLGPKPTGVITLLVDSVVLPAAINADADPEALPYPWTDAVPYYAAYMALLTAQNEQGAQAMFNLYERFMVRARALSTSSSLPSQFQSNTKPMSLASMNAPTQSNGAA